MSKHPFRMRPHAITAHVQTSDSTTSPSDEIAQRAHARLSTLENGARGLWNQIQMQYTAINEMRQLLGLPLVQIGPNGEPTEVAQQAAEKPPDSPAEPPKE